MDQDQPLVPVDLDSLPRPSGYSDWPIDRTVPPIAIGQKIYLRTSCSIGHGETDVRGGLATVKRVSLGGSAGKLQPFIETKEVPGHGYNWASLAEQQEELKKRFGDSAALPDPDYRPEFNTGRL